MLAWRQTGSRATSAARTGRWSSRIYQARRNATETEPWQRQCEPQTGVAHAQIELHFMTILSNPRTQASDDSAHPDQSAALRPGGLNGVWWVAVVGLAAAMLCLLFLSLATKAFCCMVLIA